MSHATPMSDERLLELLRRADPLAGAPPIDPSETEAGLQRLLASARADDAPAAGNATSPFRVRRRSAGTRLVHPPQRPSRRLALGAVGVLAVAGVVLGLGLPGGSGGTGAGTANAFADWTASPTSPAPGQVKAAEAACEGQRPYPGEPSFARATPKVVDTRGPWTLLVYVEGGSNRLCVVSPSGVAKHESDGGEPRIALAPGAIAPRMSGSGSGFEGEHHPFSRMDGGVGAGVTAATLVLENGTKVKTTIANGWFAAWWPGESRVTSAEVTTASGTVTEQFPALQHSNKLLRERHEQLETAKREIEEAKATGGSGSSRESASAAAPTASAGSQAARAEEACVALQDHSPVANVPYGSWRALVRDARGPYTLVLLQPSTQNASATCMATPSQANVTGLASGYPGGKPPAVAEGQLRLEGTGFQGGSPVGASSATSSEPGPYSDVYGQVGSDVSAVTLVLRDGERVTPAIANGWFVAWWRNRGSVASAEVTTGQGTSTQRIYDPAK